MLQGAGIVWLDLLEGACVGYVPTYVVLLCAVGDGMADLGRVDDGGVRSRCVTGGIGIRSYLLQMGPVYEVQSGSEMKCQTGR